jgi:hypothetical protein
MVYCVCLGGKWSGVWQVSNKYFGACGAYGKFFSKYRETLIHPKPGYSISNSTVYDTVVTL